MRSRREYSGDLGVSFMESGGKNWGVLKKILFESLVRSMFCSTHRFVEHFVQDWGYTVRSQPMIRFLGFFVLGLLVVCSALAAPDRPNILWITSEDNGTYLGCYGDEVARTPNLDALSKEGTRYLHCFSNGAVCAPARQTLIAGMYATSLGGQHMRSSATFPEEGKFFPAYLKAAGYYTSN